MTYVADQLQTAMTGLPGGNAGSLLTNAQALALLDTFGGPPLDERGIDSFLADGWRFRWLAHGWRTDGDKFAGARNAAHYRATYPEAAALIVYLQSLADASDAYLRSVGPDTLWPVFKVDAALARGDERALAQSLAESWAMMQSLRKVTGNPNPLVGLRPGDIGRAIGDLGDDVYKRVKPVIPVILNPLGPAGFALKLAAVILLLYTLDRRR